MTPTRQFRATQARRLIPIVTGLCQRALELEQEQAETLARVDINHRDSARNLIHYLAIRQVDLRPLQIALASLGLSSLGRMEAYTLSTLESVLFALHRIGNEECEPEAAATVDFDRGQMLLARHAERLLGVAAGKRAVRIMVTMPAEAAHDPALVRDLLAAGMDVMRINCAHDGPEQWAAMVDNLRRAQRELGRACRIQADLAGPKLRTGPLEPAGSILRIKPERDARGRVIKPARVWLTPADDPQPAPEGVAASLPMPRELLQSAEPRDALRFLDARERKRALHVVARIGESLLAEIDRTAYLEDAIPVTLFRGKEQLGSARFDHLPRLIEPLRLKVGDQLLLTRGGEPGRAAVVDFDGRVIAPARIPCTLEEAFDAVKEGERVWFDDGKIGGVVRANDGQVITVEITQTHPKGGRLRPGKGINLPDTDLHMPALTEQDLKDLEAVVAYADVIGFSFVREPEDVFLLHEHLERLGAKHLGVMLKIETARAFENLPQLLLASLCSPPVGIMVARGDLGVEVGFERLAEVQEEMLCLCEAAHVPVIWATQVLEGMAKKGAPSRAEITDAVMSGRAEGVMLNKGPFIVETVRFLNSLLERMAAHQSKRRQLLRRLSISRLD